MPANLLHPRDLKRIDAAIDYIKIHYQEKVSVHNLSVEVYLNKIKLQAGIQQKTGLTLHDFLLQIRIERGKELLTLTDRPIKDIAKAVGIRKAGHFSSVFKAHTGKTPTCYRNNCGL